MANLNHAIQRIRRSNRSREETTDEFAEVRDDYERILIEVDRHGNDDCVEALTTWLIEQTRASGTWPSPDTARQQALAICEAHDVEIPPDSPLTD